MDLQIIQSKIYEIRGCRVMLDSDLAALYQVETKALKQAVKRNIERFPDDFMFELTKEEVECLRSQIVTLKNNAVETEEETSSKRGKHTKYLPYVFTQEGLFFKVTICDLKHSTSSFVSSNIKSLGKRSILRLTACFKTFVST